MSNTSIKLKRNKKQSGFTLIELMVSSVIGLTIMAGAISFFVNTAKNNSDGLREIHLNQELRAVMDVMVRDIRRAGYWRNANGIISNIYSANDETILVTGGNCITYSYDDYTVANSDAAIVQNSDRAGYRLLNDTVKLRRNSSLCSNTSNWESISDSNTIKVTRLSFGIEPVCNNISSPLLPVSEQRGCLINGGPNLLLPPLAGDTLATMNVVTIIMSGNLVSDPSISTTNMTETVAVRNSVTL